MILAHGFPLATTDIDGIPTGMSVMELDPLIKEVAQELKIPPDWLNPYFSTFTHVLPKNYGNRLKSVFSFKNLKVLALSVEDLLIMKCFAGRQKDVLHIKALLKKPVDIKVVEDQLDELMKLKIPGAKEAADFLDDIMDS